MYFSWFANSNSILIRFSKPSISSILESKELYKTLCSNQFCFVALLNFKTVFSPVALFSAARTGVYYFCRDWQKISILETDIPKLKAECFGDRGWGWLCKTGSCFNFPFSDSHLFCLSNFLCIIRITWHGVLFIFLYNRPSQWWSVG